MYTREELSKISNLSVGPRLCATINKIVDRIDKDEQITVVKLLNLRTRNTCKHMAFSDFILYEALSLASELDIVEEEWVAASRRANY